MSTRIRVLLADDHALVRAGFRTILETAGDIEVVGEAGTGDEAVATALARKPDVVCMDVQMPGLDGLAATRLLTADPAATAAVLIVTTFDRDDYLFQALAAGASGFLLKNAGPEELIAAVRIVAGGDALLAPEVTGRVIARFARPRHDAPPETDGPVLSPAGAELTEREEDVLRLLARALSNAEIARALFIGEATVKTHVSNLLAKLGARDRVAAAVWAHRHGVC